MSVAVVGMGFLWDASVGAPVANNADSIFDFCYHCIQHGIGESPSRRGVPLSPKPYSP